MAEQDPSLQTFDPIEIPRRRNFIPIDNMVDQVRPPDLSKYPNAMMQLAGALKDVNPSLQRLMGTMEEQQTKVDAQSGRDSAIKSGLAYQEAVKRGIIPANASPWFQAAYKEQSGRIMGDQLYGKFMSSYANWSGRDSDNPNDFQSFLQQQKQSALQGVNDPYVMEGLAPRLEQATEQLTQHHVQYTAQRQQQGMLTGMGTELTNAINSEFSAAHMQGRAVNYDNIWAATQRVKENPRYVGLPGNQINAALTEAISNSMKETGDTNLAGVLTRQNHDGTPGPGNIPAMREKLDETIHGLWGDKMRQDEFDYTQHQRAVEEQSKAALGEAFNSVAAGKDPDWQALSAIEGHTPGAIADVQRYQDYVKHRSDNDGPLFFQHYGPALMGQMTAQQFAKAVSTYGGISTDKVVAITEALTSGRLQKGAMANPMVQEIMNKTFSDMNPAMQKAFGTHSADAAYMFQQDMMDWDAKNQSASQSEQMMHAHELSDWIIKYSTNNGFDEPTGTTTATGDRTVAPKPTNENPTLPVYMRPENQTKVQSDVQAVNAGKFTPQDFDKSWGNGAWQQLNTPQPQ